MPKAAGKADAEIVGLYFHLARLPQSQWGRAEQAQFDLLVQAARPLAFKQAIAKGWSLVLPQVEIVQCAAEGAWAVVKYLRNNEGKEAEFTARPSNLFSLLSMRVCDALMERGRAACGQRHGRATQRRAHRLRQLEAAGFTKEEILRKLGISEVQYERLGDSSYDFDGGIAAATEEQERAWAEEAAQENASFDWDEFATRAQAIIEAEAALGNVNKRCPELWRLRVSLGAEAPQAAIAAAMQLSTVRVGQLQAECFAALSKNEATLMDW